MQEALNKDCVKAPKQIEFFGASIRAKSGFKVDLSPAEIPPAKKPYGAVIPPETRHH